MRFERWRGSCLPAYCSCTRTLQSNNLGCNGSYSWDGLVGFDKSLHETSQSQNVSTAVSKALPVESLEYAKELDSKYVI